MVAFIVLKILNIISLSWWWILATPFVSLLPLGNTIVFILLKVFGGFSGDISWWWILVAIALDFIDSGIEYGVSNRDNSSSSGY